VTRVVRENALANRHPRASLRARTSTLAPAQRTRLATELAGDWDQDASATER